METKNTKAKEIVIADDNPVFRESCAVALYNAFGVVAMEIHPTDESLHQTDWSRVRTVITNGLVTSAKRLQVSAYLKHHHPEIVQVALGLEEHQLRIVL